MRFFVNLIRCVRPVNTHLVYVQIKSYIFNMYTYIPRLLTDQIHQQLQNTPVVAVLGARQVGKSTLAKKIIEKREPSIFLDLEDSRDLAKLDDPWEFFNHNHDRLICLDEVQLRPEIFTQIRVHVDQQARNGMFLILGSASPKLLRQSSETLAGRIAFLELEPFHFMEIQDQASSANHWLRGGFPRSLLHETNLQSRKWREDFIRTFVQRDLNVLGLGAMSHNLARLWQMSAHLHGQLLNLSRLAEPMGISQPTVRKYLDILQGTFLLRLLQPWQTNRLKRLVKSSKVYVRDSGLLHHMLDIEDYNELFGHPVYGPSFEGYVIENILCAFKGFKPSFYRSHHGTEVDLILERGLKKYAIEIKSNSSPKPERGLMSALDEIQPDAAWIIAQTEDSWISKGIKITGLPQFLQEFNKTEN
jgi:uncharacterized protein